MNTRRKESLVLAHPKRLTAVKNAFNLHLTPLPPIFGALFHACCSFQRTVSSQSNNTGGSSIIRRTDKSIQVSRPKGIELASKCLKRRLVHALCVKSFLAQESGKAK